MADESNISRQLPVIVEGDVVEFTHGPNGIVVTDRFRKVPLNAIMRIRDIHNSDCETEVLTALQRVFHETAAENPGIISDTTTRATDLLKYIRKTYPDRDENKKNAEELTKKFFQHFQKLDPVVQLVLIRLQHGVFISKPDSGIKRQGAVFSESRTAITEPSHIIPRRMFIHGRAICESVVIEESLHCADFLDFTRDAEWRKAVRHDLKYISGSGISQAILKEYEEYGSDGITAKANIFTNTKGKEQRSEALVDIGKMELMLKRHMMQYGNLSRIEGLTPETTISEAMTAGFPSIYPMYRGPEKGKQLIQISDGSIRTQSAKNNRHGAGEVAVYSFMEALSEFAGIQYIFPNELPAPQSSQNYKGIRDAENPVNGVLESNSHNDALVSFPLTFKIIRKPEVQKKNIESNSAAEDNKWADKTRIASSEMKSIQR